MYEHPTCACNAHRGQKRMLEPLKWKLQVVLSLLLCLGTEPESSPGAASAIESSTLCTF